MTAMPMRGFSLNPHALLIGGDDHQRMDPAFISRATLPLVLVAVLVGGVVLGSGVAMFGDDQPSALPTPTPWPSTSPSADDRMPDGDVTGVDLERLPRFPGSVRSEYGVSRDERYRLVAVEFLADATVEEVRAFYLGVIDEFGWSRADVNYAAGTWTYVLVDGRIEALVEIEEWNGLIEIDLQISEPIATPNPDPTPSPTPVPAAPPPAPAAPGGGDDDDDDDDGSDGDGSDDGESWDD